MRTFRIAKPNTKNHQKSHVRKKIPADIKSFNKKRLDYIYSNTPRNSKDKMLDASMMKAIKEQGRAKNLKWAEGC
jgi:hypothetical protein